MPKFEKLFKKEAEIAKGIDKMLGKDNPLGGLLGKFVDSLRETTPVEAEEADEARFEKVVEQIKIKNEKLRVPPGQLLVVRFVENSEITVSEGAMLDAVELTGSRVMKEEGGEVRVFKIDDSSEVVEVIPEREHKTCPNCGGPWEGHRRCGYCGSMSF